MLMRQGRPLCHCEPNKSLQVAASRISRPLEESPAPVYPCVVPVEYLVLVP